MIPTFWLTSGTLWIGNSVPAFAGMVLIDRDGQNWSTYDANTQGTFQGRRLGVCVTQGGGTANVILQGQPVAIQTHGIVPSNVYNLGPGLASTVVVTTNGLSRGNLGQICGLCDSAGSIFLFPTIVGSYAGGSRIIGEIAGYALSTTPLATGQAWVFDGTQLSPQTVLTSAGSQVSGTGLWYSTSGTLNTNAITLTGDVSQGALSGGNVPLTVVGLYGNSVSNASPASGNALVWNSLATKWNPGPINLAGGSNSVTGNLPTTNFAGGSAGQVLMMNGTPAVTWTSITQDVALSNTGVATVNGLKAVIVPSLPLSAGSYCLVYAEGTNSYTWTLTSSIGGGYSAGGDLTGNSSAQYVTSISGNNGGTNQAVPLTNGAHITSTNGNSYIDLTGANASYGYAKFLNYVCAPLHDVASASTLSLGTSNANAIAVGKSGITTTITGGLTQLTGVFSLTGNAASSLTTTSGNTSVDSAGNLNLGLSTATIKIGSSATTTSITLTTAANDPIQHSVGANSVLYQNQSSSDFISLGASAAGSGYFRIPSSYPAAIVQSGSVGTATLFGMDGNGGTYVNSYTAGKGSALYDGGSQVLKGYYFSSNQLLVFGQGSVSGVANGVGIGFDTSNSVGKGFTLAIVGQVAKPGSGAAGGGVSISSAAGDTGQADGGVQFGFNLSSLVATPTDYVGLLGATSSAGRGNMQWSSGITPKWSQVSAAYHNANATDWVWAPQQNTDGTSTSGRSGAAVVNLSAPPNTSTKETWLSVQRGGTDTVSIGPYPTAPTLGAIWLSTSFAGASATANNFAMAGDSSNLYINSGSQILFQVANTSYLELTSSALKPFTNNGITLGSTTLGYSGLYVNIISGNTATPSPVQWASVSGISLTAGSQYLTSSQVASPLVQFTGASQTGSPGTTLNLNPNGSSGSPGSFYFLDFTAVTGLGTNTVKVQVGAASRTLTVNSNSVWMVIVTGPNNLWSQLLS